VNDVAVGVIVFFVFGCFAINGGDVKNEVGGLLVVVKEGAEGKWFGEGRVDIRISGTFGG